MKNKYFKRVTLINTLLTMKSESIIYCNSSINIINLSETCVNALNITLYECIQRNDDIKSNLRTIMGVWCLLIAIFGTLGNSLTLLAIPYAAKYKRYELNRNFETTTIFVLHLAFVDLCCCLIFGPIFVSTYFSEKWPWGSPTCKMVGPITAALILIDLLSLSFVALSRCMNLTKPVFWSNFCYNKMNILLTVAVIWMIGGLFAGSFVFEPKFKFGWNCENGQCSIIKASNKLALNWRLLLGFFIPIVIMIISYTIIFYHVRQTSKYLRRDQDARPNRFNERELKMTWSILLVIFCYIVCAAPITTLKALHQEASNYFCVAYGLFSMIYIMNFLVYSYQNEQYQKAFIDYLKLLTYILYHGSTNEYSCRRSHEESIGHSSSRKATNETVC